VTNADAIAIVAMLRHMQSEPLSFDTYSVAGAAERAADAIDALRTALTASEKHLDLANKLWRMCVKDGWPWADGATQDALNALGLLYPKDMTDEDSGPECTNCDGGCDTCWRAVEKLEDVE